MLFRSLFLALFFVSLIAAQIDFSTCNGMNVPALDKPARALCNASCILKKCGSGYCENRSGRKTCVCRRCNGGK